jgi:cytochrome P450
VSRVYPSLSIWSLRRHQDRPLAFLEELAARDERIVPFRLGRHPAFLLNDPAHIEDVFVTHANKFVKGRGFDRARRLLGNGLLTAGGARHAERRHIAQPAFHHGRTPDYAPSIVAHAARTADSWQAGATVDVARAMRELTLGIIGEVLFGADLSADAAEVSDAVADALPSMDALIALVAPPRPVGRARRRLDAIVDRLVDRRVRSGEQRDDLLSMLIAAADDGTASAAELRDDLVTFLLAGHDTIANALTWTWLLLDDYPEAAARVRDEAAEASENPAGGHNLERLTYTRAVLAEALRLRPPAWVIIRRAAAPHRFGHTHIPEGAVVVASPLTMHRNPKFFPDPLAFEPGRWLSPGSHATAGRPKLAYFPFGAGGRACIGESLAWMEGTLVLATIAKRWRLTRLDRTSVLPSPRITLRPNSPVTMRVAVA